MINYTPDSHRVRRAYIDDYPQDRADESAAEFDRFIARVKADALREALEFTQTEQCPVTAPGSGDPCYRIEGHEGPHSQRKGPIYKPGDFTLKAFLQKIERES